MAKTDKMLYLFLSNKISLNAQANKFPLLKNIYVYFVFHIKLIEPTISHLYFRHILFLSLFIKKDEKIK